ncbi:MAG TPA: discoidin domain-containing protein [Verrucomicrobiae bacterium]|nr:discoidin domain-containing protein [Verrucomicrobiae bacterium]
MTLKCIGLALVLGVLSADAAETLPLAGEWQFALDPSDTGVVEQWFARELPDRIKLPGILQAQGYGDEISTNTPWVLSLYDRNWFLREDYQQYIKPHKVKVPFLCQPPRHYLGPAWYQRDVEIPRGWQGRHVELMLERPHWQTTVWVNDRKIGSQNSLCVPRVYDLGTLAPGKHRLTIRVDNRMILPYRPDAHSVSDSLGGSWNGVVGRIELTSTPTTWIDNVQVFPNVAKHAAFVKVTIGGQPGGGRLRIGMKSVNLASNSVEVEVPLGDKAQLWDEFSPDLQELTVALGSESRVVRFGLRELKAVGRQFFLNGHPIYFRMTHDGGDFPLTGHPPTDVKSWKHIFRICKAWGLNGMRFHSWCPPEAAFTAADEIGFYLSIEPGMWNTFDPGSPMEQMLYAETERILKAYGNHPSFMLFSPSNEPKGRWKEVLPQWAEHFRAKDPRRLYTSGTGFTDPDAPGPLDRVDYIATQRFGRNPVRGERGWFGGDYRHSLEGVGIPVIAHEVGQWCAYPNFDVINKFTGYLRPGNYEIFRDSLAAHGLLDRDKDFAWASGRFQLACYKEEIEANLRTPGLSGFQLLDLHDYMGQGTALVGLLDPFWERKGYATPEEFHRFCGATVLLARLPKRVLTTADPFAVDVEVAHFGPKPLSDAVPVWRVVSAHGATVASGQLPAREIPLGKNIALGTVPIDLSKLAAPRQYKLLVGLKERPFENSWNFWLYPAAASPSPSENVLVTSSWDEAEVRLKGGGRVLFLPQTSDLDWTSPPLANVPIFWNRLMGPKWSRMLGLWCDTRHPALAEFPTEQNCDWQWTEMIRNSRALNMDSLPQQLPPIVQAIDDWNRNYKLGLIFECRVGPGRLMVCSVDLQDSLNKRPAACQLRRSLLDYMSGNKFQPRVAVAAADIRGLLFDTRIMHKLGATAHADSATRAHPAANAIDGDPNTYWLADGREEKHPHELSIDFPEPVTVTGLVCMPRQDQREHEGDIREYTIQTSDDGEKWNDVVRGEMVSSFAPKKIVFPQALTTRHLRFTAVSGFGSDNAAALAELAVVGPKSLKVGSPVHYKATKSATPEIDD